MRTILGLITSVILVVLGGCEATVPDEELGTVLDKVPKIEEPGEPYELPHIPAPAKPSKETDEAPPEP